MEHSDHLSLGHDFDWSPNGDDCASIVVPDQAAIAVYSNPRGEVCIRQDGHAFQSEDPYIVVRKGHCAALAFALLREAGLSSRRPLAPQIAELMAAPAPFDMREAGRFFKALDDELADGDRDTQSGPIRRDLARMMVERPDIRWDRVLDECNSLFDENDELRPVEGEAVSDGEQLKMEALCSNA